MLPALASMQKNKWSAFAAFSGLGIEIVVSVGGGLLLGDFLDNHFHTKPWFLVLGLLMGTSVFVIHLVYLLRQYDENDSENK